MEIRLLLTLLIVATVTVNGQPTASDNTGIIYS